MERIATADSLEVSIKESDAPPHVNAALIKIFQVLGPAASLGRLTPLRIDLSVRGRAIERDYYLVPMARIGRRTSASGYEFVLGIAMTAADQRKFTIERSGFQRPPSVIEQRSTDAAIEARALKGATLKLMGAACDAAISIFSSKSILAAVLSADKAVSQACLENLPDVAQQRNIAILVLSYPDTAHETRLRAFAQFDAKDLERSDVAQLHRAWLESSDEDLQVAAADLSARRLEEVTTVSGGPPTDVIAGIARSHLAVIENATPKARAGMAKTLLKCRELLLRSSRNKSTPQHAFADAIARGLGRLVEDPSSEVRELIVADFVSDEETLVRVFKEDASPEVRSAALKKWQHMVKKERSRLP